MRVCGEVAFSCARNVELGVGLFHRNCTTKNTQDNRLSAEKVNTDQEK